MELRKLTLEEVEFTVSIEPEESGPDGHFCSDEPELDKEMVDEIEGRLRRGDQLAWCTLVVVAKWNDFTVTNTLGACSFADQKDMDSEVESHGMKDEALGQLQTQLQNVFNMLVPLASSSV